MNLGVWDWAIVGAFISFLLLLAFSIQKHTRSVADFLAANRCGGRYLLSTADGMVGLGAISIISLFEIYYKAGFTALWWGMIQSPVILLVTLTGWVIYRFRQTRSLTLLQFFELRYSKRFRVFIGLIAFFSGLVGLGIFPAVGARFFINFCGFPHTFDVFGLSIATFPFTMAVLLITALYFTLSGGQVTVMVTDFLQGMFCNVVFLIILGGVLLTMDWSLFTEGLSYAPADQSMVHPFHTGATEDYDVWFYLIASFNLIFIYPSWQGTQAYQCAARTPHEARMAKVLTNVRGMVIYTVILLLPVAAYVVMQHPAYSAEAAQVSAALAQLENPQIQSQMTVPVALAHFLPTGLVGAFCAVMLAAFITTHDSMLHAWGSIFIQDCVLPFRKKPFKTENHMRLLRIAICGVAVWLFVFSLLFHQNQDIVMHWAIVGAIYYTGAGAALVFGLYWRPGTTAGAWAATFVGFSLGTYGFFAKYHDWYIPYDMNSQWMSFWIAIAGMSAYVGVSLLERRLKKMPSCNLDAILHRGKYALAEEQGTVYELPPRGLKALGIGTEFSRGDKVIYLGVMGNALVSFLIFAV